MRIENRQHPRVPCNWPATILTHEQPLDGTVENISNEGLFVRSNRLVPRRKILSMILEPPNYASLEIIVQTVWENVWFLPNDEIEAIGVGTRILNIPYVDRQFLATIISDYLKVEYEKESFTSKVSNWPFITCDRIEMHRLKCHLCKAYLLMGPTEETCPICGIPLSRQGI